MRGTMAAGEFSRNARLVLRLMGKADARLVEAGAGAWVIESGRNRRRSRQTVADDMVRELAARECLVREPAGGYRISVAGERLMAGEGEDREEGVGGQHRLLRRRAGKGRRGTTGPALNEAESPLGWLRSRRDRHGEPLIS